MRPVRRVRARDLLAAGLVVATTAGFAQAPAPPASSPKAKELGTLLAARKLESFAAVETGSKFVAVLHTPGVQMLVVSAAYGRPMDFDYRLLHKQYQEIYMELKSSMLAADRFYVEDILADGLVLIPAKNAPADAVVVGVERRVFDGDFGDPRRKNQKKISQEEYNKHFADADTRYAVLLDILIAAVKKVGLAAPEGLR
jgi:hypothetical protein